MNISGSIEVSMGACHALDPGSIPGRRVFFLINYSVKLSRKTTVNNDLNSFHIHLFIVKLIITVKTIERTLEG